MIETELTFEKAPDAALAVLAAMYQNTGDQNG